MVIDFLLGHKVLDLGWVGFCNDNLKAENLHRKTNHNNRVKETLKSRRPDVLSEICPNRYKKINGYEEETNQ